MRQRLASWILWVFVIGTAFILGAGVYEQLVVVPFWAGDAPRSLMESNPILRVPLRSGHVFWPIVTPGLSFLALAAFLTSFVTPRGYRAWRLVSTGILLLAALATFTYFRPSIINMVVYHGAGRTDDVLAASARMWVGLNWLRIGAVLASVGMGVRALTVFHDNDEQNRKLIQEKPAQT
jgi:hypothetical protein